MGLLAVARALLAFACTVAAATTSAAVPARVDGPDSVSAAEAALHARHAALASSLARNAFNRPLHLESTEGEASVSGEISALAEHPFSDVSAALYLRGQWCDVLILHLNTKYCRPSGNAALVVGIGKKHDQPVEDAHRLEFAYRLVARTATYLQVKLDAAEGPAGTRDYRIVLEAAPAGDGRTFLRLTYAYAFGTTGRLAMRVYLGTLGRDKVGFTVVGREPGGEPRLVGGMRGVVERNTMRYYLAVEAYLGALSAPPAARAEKSFRDWFAAIERFPRQLHELEQGEYLAMKRKEYSRQKSVL